MSVKFLLAAGTAVAINGLQVILDADVECEAADPTLTVDQVAEACNLAGVTTDLSHVDNSGEASVAVTYAAADAQRIETPVDAETPAPDNAPTSTDIAEGNVVVPISQSEPVMPEPVVVSEDPAAPSEEETATVVDAAPAEVVSVTETAPAEDAPAAVVEETPVADPAPAAEAAPPTPEATFEAAIETAEKEFEADVEK